MLVIPDLHCPWQHPRAYEFLSKLYERWKCDKVVCLGDEVDMASYSTKWKPNPDLPSPSDELELAVEQLQGLYDLFPECSLVESNHGNRAAKKAYESGLPERILKTHLEIIQAPPGWTFEGKQYELDGVLYVHGVQFSQNSWKVAYMRWHMPVVIGHLHTNPGVMWSITRKHRFFAMNTGCLIDPLSKAFKYGEDYADRPALGAGIVIDGEQCYFEPMLF